MRFLSFIAVVGLALHAGGAELVFDFGKTPEGKTPEGFRSTLSGTGKPGDWQVLLEPEAPMLPPISPQAAPVTKRPVLAQLSRDTTDERYPLFIREGEVFGDFTLTTKFKLVDGAVEQMAGIAFRIQDEKNYYYVRASGLGNTFYFFKFVKGELIGPIGSKVSIPKGVWHELKVECRGSQVTCSLNGKAIIPDMHQDTFRKGKIGFWTKSDSLAYFADTRIVYTPLEAPAQKIVQELAAKYPRLLGLKVYVRGIDGGTRTIGSNDAADLNQPGGKTEESVLRTGETYYGKEKDVVSVIMPLRDRNGDALAVARVVMKSFPGQTEQNAIVRAMPIVKQIQSRVNTLDDLVE